MPTLFGYAFSLKKIRHHWLVTKLSQNALTSLQRLSDAAAVAATTVSVIQKIKDTPSDELSYTNLMVAGSNHLVVYYLRLINAVRSYNEIEAEIEADHLEDSSIPHEKLIALLEFLQFGLMAATSFYPMAVASQYPADKNTVPVVMQIIAIAVSNLMLRPLENWLLLRALSQVQLRANEMTSRRALTIEQQQAADSELFFEWFKTGLTFTEFRRLTNFQLSIVKEDTIVNNYIQNQLLTKEEALGISPEHFALLCHSLFIDVLGEIEVNVNKKALVNSALVIPSVKILAQNLDIQIISLEITRHHFPILIAAQLEPHHVEALRQDCQKCWDLIMADSTGGLFLQQRSVDDVLYEANYLAQINRSANLM